MPERAAALLAEIEEALAATPDPERELERLAEVVRVVTGCRLAIAAVHRVTGEFQVVAGASDDGRHRDLLGTHIPDSVFAETIDEPHLTSGSAYFAREEDRTHDLWAFHVPTPPGGPIGMAGAADAPSRWGATDCWGAVLRDDDGLPVVWFQVDDPVSGRRPAVEALAALDRICAPVGGLVRRADQELRLRHAVQLADRSRTRVRRDIAQRTRAGVAEAVARTLLEHFEVDVIFVDLGPGTTPVIATLDPEQAAPHRFLSSLTERAVQSAERYWSRGIVSLISASRTVPDDVPDEAREHVLAGLEERGLHAAILVPVGWRSQALGVVSLLRSADRPDWSDVDLRAAVELGRDIGSALHVAGLFEREQRQAEERAQLVGTMAHELKAPLTAAQGFLELVEDAAGGCSELGAAVQGIRDSGERVQAIVDDLLLLSRTWSAALPESGTGDLVAAVRGSVARTADAAATAGVRVEIEVEEPLPALAVPLAPDLLVRVVTNLLLNAVRYSDPGTTTTVVVAGDGDDAVLAVVDGGWGIAAPEMTHVGTEFFRSADPRVRSRPGAGLGLAVATRLVDAAGGALSLDSTPGRGTVARVRLPRAEAAR